MRFGATDSLPAAIVGSLLALPFALLFTLLTLGIEPPLGPLKDVVASPPEGPNVIGTAIVLGAWLLAIVAFAINLAPIVRDARAGRSLFANPLNPPLALVIGFFVLAFVGGIVVDQYPCWVGVPNCD